MKKLLSALLYFAFLTFILINCVYAAEDLPLNQFLGSPLLALAIIVVIVLIAFLYRKIRR